MTEKTKMGIDEIRETLNNSLAVADFDLRMDRYVHPIAAVALDLLKSHPNVAGVEDGEDSAGRSKLRLQRANEMVERSYKIAELWYEKMVAMSKELPSKSMIIENKALGTRLIRMVEFPNTYE